jgi:hypothetical protein
MATRTKTGFVKALMDGCPALLVQTETKEIRLFNVGRRKFAALVKAAKKIISSTKKRK